MACLVGVVWTLPACQPTAHAEAGAAVAQAEQAPAQVIVVGGGVAGLVTAYELEKRGVSTHILEMQEVLGGRVATVHYEGGLSREAGLQELWQDNPLVGIAHELGVPLEEGLEAYSSVVIDGELHPYVQDTDAEYFASFLSPQERQALDAWMAEAASLYELARTQGLDDPKIRRLQEISFEQWIRESGLPDKDAAWIRVTLTCELATEWSSFSALFGLLEFHIFLHGGLPNYHVRGGNSRLVEALAAHIQGPKTLSARVSRIERLGGPGGTRVRVSYEKDHQTHTLEAARVVSTVPFTHLHRIVFDPPLSDAHWRSIGSLGLGKYVVVHLLMDREAEPLWIRDGVSVMPILTEGPLGVIYGPPSEEPEQADETVFSLLIYGAPARAFHMVPQSRKVAEILSQLDRMFPGFSAHVHSSYVYSYHPAAVATWPVGRSPLDALSELLRVGDQGLYFAGDWTLDAHSDGAARSGLRVAEQIAAELGTTGSGPAAAAHP